MRRELRAQMYKNQRVGTILLNNEGCRMEVVEYNSATDILIRFLDKDRYEKRTTWRKFTKGQVTNPFYKSVFNIGFIGIDNLNHTKDKAYRYWKSMMRRCYSEATLKRRPTYKDKYVCRDWHNYSVFKHWFNRNYYTIDGARMELDKDVLLKNNRVYSPYSCVFVPRDINQLFLKRQSMRGNYPIGVKEVTDSSSYQANCKNLLLRKNIYLGVYPSPKLAFQAYKKYKENHIKEVADHYKDKIPKKLYDAMYRYEVEITD